MVWFAPAFEMDVLVTLGVDALTSGALLITFYANWRTQDYQHIFDHPEEWDQAINQYLLGQ